MESLRYKGTARRIVMEKLKTPFNEDAQIRSQTVVFGGLSESQAVGPRVELAM
jgi:hypothetical protein